MLDSDPILTNVPTVEQVVALVGEGESPSVVLEHLMAIGHARADAQRGMQRALDIGRIEFNTALRFELSAS